MLNINEKIIELEKKKNTFNFCMYFYVNFLFRISMYAMSYRGLVTRRLVADSCHRLLPFSVFKVIIKFVHAVPLRLTRIVYEKTFSHNHIQDCEKVLLKTIN